MTAGGVLCIIAQRARKRNAFPWTPAAYERRNRILLAAVCIWIFLCLRPSLIHMHQPPPAQPEGAGVVPSTVEGRVDKIDILLAHAVLRKAQSLTEAYKME